jgi:hypothetical protein
MQLQPDWLRPLPPRIVIPTVATLTTLADARVLIEQLPEITVLIRFAPHRDAA